MDSLEYWFYYFMGFSMIINNVTLLPKIGDTKVQGAIAFVTLGIGLMMVLLSFKHTGLLKLFDKKKRVKNKEEDG